MKTSNIGSRLLLSAVTTTLGGCATVPPAPFPVALRSTDRVRIVSASVRPAEHGVRVAGFAQSRSLTMLPWGSHIHVVAELTDGNHAVADAAWRPSVRKHMPTASYQTLLRNVAAEDVMRIAVEYRSTRDE